MVDRRRFSEGRDFQHMFCAQEDILEVVQLKWFRRPTSGVASSHLIFRVRQPQHPVNVLTRLTLRELEGCPAAGPSILDVKNE